MKGHMRPKILFAILVSALFLAGCMSSKPPGSEVAVTPVTTSEFVPRQALESPVEQGPPGAPPTGKMARTVDTSQITVGPFASAGMADGCIAISKAKDIRWPAAVYRAFLNDIQYQGYTLGDQANVNKMIAWGGYNSKRIYQEGDQITMPSDINVLLVILGITVSAEGAPGAIEKPVPGAEVEGVVPGGEVPEVVECTTLTADTAVQWKLDPDTLQLSLSWPNFSCSFTVYGGPPGATSTAIDVVEVTDYTLTYTNGWLYTIQGNEPNSRTGTILQTEWIDPSTALTVVEGTPRAAVATLTPVPPLGEVPGAPIVKGQGVTMKKIFFVGLSLLVSLAAAWGSFSIFSTEGGVDFKQKLLGAFAMELVVVCWILVPVNFSVLSITPSGIMPLNFGKGIIAVVAAGITIAAMLYLHIKMQKQDIEPRELLPWAFCIFSVMTLVQVIAMLMIGFIQT